MPYHLHFRRLFVLTLLTMVVHAEGTRQALKTSQAPGDEALS
jgi:hypothetical protein